MFITLIIQHIYIMVGDAYLGVMKAQLLFILMNQMFYYGQNKHQHQQQAKIEFIIARIFALTIFKQDNFLQEILGY